MKCQKCNEYTDLAGRCLKSCGDKYDLNNILRYYTLGEIHPRSPIDEQNPGHVGHTLLQNRDPPNVFTYPRYYCKDCRIRLTYVI